MAATTTASSLVTSGGGPPHPGAHGIGAHVPYTGREEVFKKVGLQVPDGYRQNHPYDARFSSFFRMLGSNRWGQLYYFKRAGVNLGKVGIGFLLLYFPLDAVYCDIRKWKRDNAGSSR